MIHLNERYCGPIKLLIFSVMLTLMMFPVGCANEPGSGGFSGAAHTWPSREHAPATVTLVNSATGQTIWSLDVPPGQWLITQFVDGGGPDPVELPDRLDYRVVEAGKRAGRLHSSIGVPPASSRRWELTYRDAPEARDRNEFPGDAPFNFPEWWHPNDVPVSRTGG